MARKAREAAPDGLYHIQQSSTDQRCLFESNEERMKFLELIKEAKQIYGFKLYAYCLEDKNAYHLVIHANGCDVTKLMKSLNIAYAMYVKFDGPLFKDRYKSTLIENKCEFDRIIAEIICSKKLGSCFNSETEFCDDEDPFESVCKDCIKTSEDAYQKLLEIADAEQIAVEELLKDKDRRNALIVTFRKTSILSLKDIGELFGGLTESSVSKILKSSF